MFDHFLRALKDRLFAPVARAMGAGIHPNVVTVLAFLVGLVTAAAAAQAHFRAALALWIVNRLLDGLDGSIARAQNTQSDFGGYLDILLDFAVYAAIPIGIVMGAPSPAANLAALALLASFFVNAASWMYLSAILERRAAGAAARGELTTVTMPPGLIAGTETFVFYSLFLLFPEHITTLFAIMAALVGVTIAQRLVVAARAL